MAVCSVSHTAEDHGFTSVPWICDLAGRGGKCELGAAGAESNTKLVMTLKNLTHNYMRVDLTSLLCNIRSSAPHRQASTSRCLKPTNLAPPIVL